MAATVEATQTLLQSESRVQRSYRTTRTERHSAQHALRHEHVEQLERVEQHERDEQQAEQRAETRQLKKKKSTRRHNDEGTVSVARSSEKLKAKLSGGAETCPECAACGRAVFAMERVQAERRAWHRDCFRCSVCRKQLSVETYASEQATLYCAPHFRQLHAPRPADDDEGADETVTSRKHEVIICESKPVELPPDVVRGSAKPELGLEDLAALDVRSRFQVFERGAEPAPPAPAPAPVPRATSGTLLAKIAKFKARGLDVGAVGVPDECLAAAPASPSGSDADEADGAGEGEGDGDAVLRQSYLVGNREAPVPAANLGELLGRWEAGATDAGQRRQERKQEIQNIRSRLFMGKQAKIKEMYEQSVLQSEQGVTSAEKLARELELDGEKARAIKQRFESGQAFAGEEPPRRAHDDPAVFDHGLGKQSRSLFLQLDASAQGPPLSPPPQEPPRRKEIPFVPAELVRSEERPEEVRVHTADISDRFKFFETYREEPQRKQFRMTPPRAAERPPSPDDEPYREPGAVRCEPAPPDTGLAKTRQTASRMISVFRDLEERQHCAEPAPPGPKPLKRFTPPPPGERAAASDSDSAASDSDSDDARRDQRYADDALVQAQQVCRARSFRERFERGRPPSRSPSPPRAAPHPLPTDDDADGESQLETAKSLRDKFESMRVQRPATVRAAPAVHRFV